MSIAKEVAAMADTRSIFIGYHSSLEDLAHELNTLIGMRLNFVPDETDHEFDRYEMLTEHLDTILTSASGFENDRDMHFEDYQYYVGISVLGRVATLEERGELECERDDSARLVFKTLKTTARFPLLLVHNMETKLNEFSPAPTSLLSPTR